ncbi:MAG TPA: hypothetical protein PKE63_06370 [Lacibacter sp.]|nr:hypothetical protein [Lacibacter sp.]HMO89730.1 hypothetical protein [Lacibacter sp.]HMP86884.1 hypothetical protein [Lacibacter sp.]
MYKPFLSLLLLFVFTQAATAQKNPAAVNAIMGSTGEPERPGKGGAAATGREFLRITIPEGGANGASVVYHPREKLYYAAQAGNAEFPLIIFDESGKIVSETGQATLIDVRGLWYNPRTKQIEGNGYKEFGWFNYSLNRKGLPEKINNTKEGRFQPDDHSAGVLNTQDNEVLFLSGTTIIVYNTNGTPANRTIKLKIGSRSNADGPGVDQAAFENDYNYRSIIYTERKGAEIGFLNITKKQVELYDIKTGYLTQTISLPLDFVPEGYFNFSFSNDTYWVFNKTTREWIGYRAK